MRRIALFVLLAWLVLASSGAHAATFTVNLTTHVADSSLADGVCDTSFTTGLQCTLRAAIEQANNDSTADTINFNIPGTGVKTITPTSALPTITQPVTINGYSQPGSRANTLATGNNAVLLIELNGASAGASTNGLVITAGSSTVKGLVINRFGASGGSGIFLNSGGNSIQGCFLGTNVTGTTDLGNGFVGIYITGSNNTIGSSAPASRNVISGNTQYGVYIENSTSKNNRVHGNYIGTNAAGTADLGNTRSGVAIIDPTNANNFVGGTLPGEGNVISGNDQHGVFLQTCSGNWVQGNIIGLSAAGTAALGNTQDGIQLSYAPDNTIGGTSPGARNVISGNNRHGLYLAGSLASGNTVQGNIIGLNAAGTANDLELGNAQDGVRVEAAPDNLIGGTLPGARNVISFNQYGVRILGSSASGNKIQGNYIGLNAAGLDSLANRIGVQISGAPNTLIGGTSAAARNVISGNIGAGIEIRESPASGTVVQGNYIGINASGTGELGNGAEGVFVSAAPNNTIGGTLAGARNVISGNGRDGIFIGDSRASGNVVQGNYIGTNAAGTAAMSNAFHGLSIAGAPNTIIGGTVAAARNVISGNEGFGIYVVGSSGNEVQGNTIGLNAAGTAVLGNGSDGVVLDAAWYNAIGGAASARNVIAGNGRYGVHIMGGSDNVVQGNAIGTNAGGTARFPNASHGVRLDANTLRNTIGGSPEDGNTIAFNGGDGVEIESGTSNAVLYNSIYGNTGIGIDLFPDGVTPNDADDPDSGANNRQNFPVITAVTVVGGATRVVGTLNSTPLSSFLLDFFSGPDAEGKTYAASTMVTTSSGGDASFNVTISPALPPDQFVTATATDVSNNTSEFSAAKKTPPAPAITISNGTLTEGNSGTSNMTFTVSLSAQGGQTVTVNYTTLDGTALRSADYVRRTGSLTFNPGETAKTITVPIVGDVMDEADETFFVELSSPVTATFADDDARGTIVDNDAPPSLSINDVSVTEGNVGNMSAVFAVSLSAPSGKTIMVDFYTVNGSALANSDYYARTGTLTFLPGRTTRTVIVTIIPDTLDEVNETFRVFLADPDEVTIADGLGIGTITDDDAPASVASAESKAKSPVALTVAEAFVSGQIVQLTFSGALDATTAGDVAHYSVTVNQFVVASSDASYNAEDFTVKLLLPDGSLKEGDEVVVSWHDLRDTGGHTFSGQSAPLVAQ